MNNGNLPAAPILGDTDAYVLFLEGIKGGNNYGLTKREHFAAMAMAAMLSSPKDWMIMDSDVSMSAVDAADALLTALEAK